MCPRRACWSSGRASLTQPDTKDIGGLYPISRIQGLPLDVMEVDVVMSPDMNEKINRDFRRFFFAQDNRSLLPWFDRDLCEHRVGNKAFAMGLVMKLRYLP